jgi:aminoglycoside phosphotransferase (APT) family kinase protein
MVRLLVALQVEWTSRVDELLELGLPDWRPEPLRASAADVVARTACELEPATVRTLERLVEELPARADEVASCGVPTTLVHGDFHRGNVRGAPDQPVLLDWGDSGVGHPLLDQAAFLEWLPEAECPAVRREWSRLWRAAVPGSDPERAGQLLEPVAALRQAVIYRKFLDAIEPDERVYHATDPAIWLERAAAFAASA